MWSKKPRTEPDPKIARRVQKMSRSDLVTWADQAIYSTGRSLTAYEREADPAFLDEASTGAEVLRVLIEEIRQRDAR